MYFRTATWYFKFEKKGKVSYGASILVSLSQVLILTDVLWVFFMVFYEKSERQIVMDKFKPFYIVIILTIAFLNDFKYKDKYDTYKEMWKNQNKKAKQFYGFIIFLLLIIPLIFIPIIVSVFDFNPVGLSLP